MRTLHSILNMPEYALTDFWIWICQNSGYVRVLNMQELHRALNMPQYGWICLNRMWICLDMSESTMIDRVLNIYHTIHSARSLCKLMNAYWEIGVFRMRSKIKDGLFNYFNKKSILNLWEGSEYESCFIHVRVLNICKFSLIWQGSEYASGCNYEKVLNSVRFQCMQAFQKVLNMSKYGWVMPYGRILNIPDQRFTGFEISLRF